MPSYIKLIAFGASFAMFWGWMATVLMWVSYGLATIAFWSGFVSGSSVWLFLFGLCAWSIEKEFGGKNGRV